MGTRGIASRETTEYAEEAGGKVNHRKHRESEKRRNHGRNGKHGRVRRGRNHGKHGKNGRVSSGGRPRPRKPPSSFRGARSPTRNPPRALATTLFSLAVPGPRLPQGIAAQAGREG
ncbi:MAG: hypothetical protein D6679_05125 [Candidatus Hydrogenedentota bacterium]|nr:MAG: hypothetical protein D6679_05125 [Candidatus Hydrogenedentota bacterium]